MALYEAANVSPEIANHESLVARNLDTIRKYTNLVFLWEDKNPMGWIIGRASKESSFDIETTRKLLLFSEIFKPLHSAVSAVRDNLIPYGLEPGILNKYEVEEAVDKINTLLLKPENIEKYKQYAPNGITFEELVRLSLSFMPNADDLQKVCGIYFMIDQLGYYSDRSVKKRIMALWRDSMHTAWAGRAQLFISNDKKLRMKAQLTYRTLGIVTPVLDPDQAVSVILYMIQNGDQLKREYEQARGQKV